MTDKKIIHTKPSLYGFYFEVIKEIGLKYGYNIVLHGSMNRDLDLIAVPWEETVGDKEEMLNKIAEAMGGHILIENDNQRKLLRKKAHGRESWVVNINRTIEAKYGGMVTEFVDHQDPQYYIDISVLPILIEPKEHKNVRAVCVNIKEGEKYDPTNIQSIPSEGLVKEYSDRSEWDVITESGLLVMKFYKRDFVWVEMLY